MQRFILLILGFLFICNKGISQKENWIKVDIFRAGLFADIGLSFESKNEKKGFEAQLVYRGDKRSITDWSGYDFRNPITLNTLPRFDFKQKTLEAIFSYKWYPNFSKKKSSLLVSSTLTKYS